MGFPIVLGPKSISSKTCALPDPMEEYADDGMVLYPFLNNDQAPMVVTAASPDQSLQAVAVISFYDMLRADNGSREWTVAQVCLQLAPLGAAFSSHYRDSTFRLPLPQSGAKSDDARMNQNEIQRLSPDLQFSSDRRFLTCLIPHPWSQETSVVCFQLRKPRSQLFRRQASRPQPPLPDYLTQDDEHGLEGGEDVSSSSTSSSVPNSGNSQASLLHHQHQQGLNGSSHHSTTAATAAATAAPTTPTPVQSTGTIPVATKPRMLPHDVLQQETRTKQAATCICDVQSAMHHHGNSNNHKSSSSMLLVGCRDGRILAVSYRPFCVAGVVYEGAGALEDVLEMAEHNGNSNGNANGNGSKNSTEWSSPIVAMDHCLEWQDEAQGTVAGKLVVLGGNGSATIFVTHQVTQSHESAKQQNGGHQNFNSLMEESERWGDLNESSSSLAFLNESSASLAFGPSPDDNNDTAVLIGLSKVHKSMPGPFTAARWICGSYLCLLERPGRTCRVHVYGLSESSTLGPLQPVSTLVMNDDLLQDEAHTKYAVRPAPAVGSSNGFVSSPRSHLQYDASTDCLAVSSFLQDAHQAHAVQHFCCLWNWRSNTLGLTIKPSKKAWPSNKLSTSSSAQQQSSSKLLSSLYFSKTKSGQRKLVHLTTATGVNPLRVSKDVYEMAILSPASDTSRLRARIRPTSSLLLSNMSVSYPRLHKNSLCLPNYELAWQESSIPAAYLSNCGSPVQAAIGPHFGRSIAVASSKGLCLLDCGGGVEKSVTAGDPVSSTSTSSSSSSLKEGLKQLYHRPRWYLFGNESQERRFRVLAMAWWEGVVTSAATIDDNKLTKDIIVAMIQVGDSGAGGGPDESGRYLACWTHRHLDAGHQLIVPSSQQQQGKSNGNNNTRGWGCRLPDDFHPEYMDLLVEPNVSSACGSSSATTEEPSTRKACVLLADTSFLTAYQVYQLEVVNANDEDDPLGQLPFLVLSHCAAAKTTVGSPAEVFLASARFSFSLQSTSVQQKDDYVATLGIVRTHGGGLSAVAVGTTDVIAFGQVVSRATKPSAHETATAELSRVSLTDVVRNRRFSQDDDDKKGLDFFVWTLQTASGNLLTWFVPVLLQSDQGLFDLVGRERFLQQDKKSTGSPRAVHRTGLALGYVTKAGSTSTWMQQSSQGTKKDCMIGCAPQSSYGCVLGVSQSVRKLHRSLGEDFEDELFRPDFLDHELLCPSDFVLYPPAWLPSMYALLVDAATTTTTTTNDTTDKKDRMDHVEEHLAQKLSTSALRDTTMMALHLLVLRSVEKVASTSKEAEGSDKNTVAKRVFERIVTAIRRATTPLQFATLFLEVGRQVEPSVFQHLFPLPLPEGEENDWEPESMENLFTVALDLGSVTMAVAALPMFAEKKKTLSVCAGIFRSCLKALNRSLENETPLTFDLSKESNEAMGDIFRYARKIEDPGWDDESYGGDDDNEDPAREFSAHSAGDSEDEDRVGRVKSGGTYSILCGFDRLFTRRRESRRKEDGMVMENGFDDHATELGRHSFRRNSTTNGARNRRRRSYASILVQENIESVTAMTARFIVASIFEPGTSMAQTRWKKLAVLSDLLVGENATGFQFCSSSAFEGMLRVSTSMSFEVLMPWKVDMVRFFTRNLRESESQIDERAASKVLDLMLILLDTESSVGDLSKDLPGLLLIAMVAAHTADRITDIINYDPRDLPLWNSYLDARYELASFDDEDDDEEDEDDDDGAIE